MPRTLQRVPASHLFGERAHMVEGGNGLPHPHQKQFLLGPRPVQVGPNWKRVQVGDSLYLSYCAYLAVDRLISCDGEAYFLLGFAVSAVDSELAAGFSRLNAADVEGATAFWAGKWALISKSACITDASGCLGIYYRRFDGEVWLASSPAILGKHLPGATEAPLIGWEVKHGVGIDWIPAPLSTRRGVYKLLPQRRINPLSGKITPQSPIPEFGPGMAEFLTTIMRRWSESALPRKEISLTAGLDTRTVLAAAVRAGIKVPTYTVVNAHTPWADRTLPPKIANKVGLVHRVKTRSPDSRPDEARRWAVARENADQIFIHPLWKHLVEGQLDPLDAAGTRANGNVFELGRCYYWNKFLQAEPPDSRAILSAFFTRCPEPTEIWKDALDLWLSSLSDPVPVNMDWRDRFYHEQRLGSWYSTIQRAADLTRRTIFPPANSLWFICLMLQVPVHERKGGLRQLRLIDEMCPILAALPINPPSLKQRAKRFVKALLRR